MQWLEKQTLDRLHRLIGWFIDWLTDCLFAHLIAWSLLDCLILCLLDGWFIFFIHTFLHLLSVIACLTPWFFRVEHAPLEHHPSRFASFGLLTSLSRASPATTYPVKELRWGPRRQGAAIDISTKKRVNLNKAMDQWMRICFRMLSLFFFWRGMGWNWLRFYLTMPKLGCLWSAAQR